MKWKNEINKLKQCWTISYISFQSSFKFKFIPVRNRYTKKNTHMKRANEMNKNS